MPLPRNRQKMISHPIKEITGFSFAFLTFDFRLAALWERDLHPGQRRLRKSPGRQLWSIRG
jgi:hypothetical protein